SLVDGYRARSTGALAVIMLGSLRGGVGVRGRRRGSGGPAPARWWRREPPRRTPRRRGPGRRRVRAGTPLPRRTGAGRAAPRPAPPAPLAGRRPRRPPPRG